MAEENSPIDAIFQYECGHEKDNIKHEFLCEIGKLYMRIMNYDMAIDFFNRALKISENNIKYIMLRANYYYFKKDYNNAIEDYYKFKSIKEDDIDLYINLFRAKFKNEDPTVLRQQ